MDTDATDHPEAPAWTADLLRHLGQAGPFTPAALAERLRAGFPGLTAEQVERELRARLNVHETVDGWVSLLAVADGAFLTHVLSAQERQAGMLAADGDLDLWARLADEGLPLAGGGTVRTRWAVSPEELPRNSGSALAGPDGWLDAFEDDAILTLRLRDGALDVGTLADQEGDGEEVDERAKTVVEACAGAALAALRAFADAAGVDEAEDDEPSDPGAPLDTVLADLLVTRPDVLDDPLPPLSLMLTAAGLEVAHGVVMLPGAPWDPDEVEGLSAEEIRWFTLARGFLWTHDADETSTEELDRFLTVLTFSPLVLERIADEVEGNPVDAALLEAARRAGATPTQRAVAALLAARAADGDGRPAEAERLVLEALGQAPTASPRYATRPTTPPPAATLPAPTHTCAGPAPRPTRGSAARCSRCWCHHPGRPPATAPARAGRDASTSCAACAPPPIPSPLGRRRAMPASPRTLCAPPASRPRGSTPSSPCRKRPCSCSIWRSSRAASSTTTSTSAGTCCRTMSGPWRRGGARCRWPPTR